MSRGILAPFLVAMVACTVGPDYAIPPVDAPPAWGESADPRAADLVRWWTVFEDATLESLIDRAVQSNLDLRTAQARIREARAQAGIASSALQPELVADGSATRLRTSKNGPFGAAGFPLYRNDFLATFDASWEIDVFGGTRRAVEAATADLEATIQDRNAVLVSLLGEVARNYVELRGGQRQLAVLRGNVASAKGSVDLTKARLQAGVATALDVARAEALLAAVSSDVPVAARAIRQSLYRLGVLLGKSPRSLEGELAPEAPIPAGPPTVATGLPSGLLRRRPDVRRAERQLAAATARVGQATAEYYPKFTLLGSFGAESLKTGNWFSWPSRLWSVGPAVHLPLFQGGRIQATVEVQNARQEQARMAFDQAFLVALEEVENALTAWTREGERHGSLEAEVAADRRAADLAEDLHRKGLVSFLDVLEAQRSLYGAELQLAQSEASRSVDLVALYKALGGGWDPATND